MNQQSMNNKVDLQELVVIFYNNRWLMLLITGLSIVVAIGFSFFTKPVYRATAEVTQAFPSSLLTYNIAIQSDESNLLQELEPKDVFELFLQTLESDELLTKAALSHKVAVEKKHNSALISAEARLAEEAVEQVEQSIEAGIKITQKLIAEALTDEVEILRERVNIKRKELTSQEKIKREARINDLENALYIAEKINLTTPYLNVYSNFSGENLYMRGTDALRAEIELLKQKTKNNEFYSESINSLFIKEKALDSISVALNLIGILRVLNSAQGQAELIKPNKKLFIAVGILFGLIMSIFIVLVKEAFRINTVSN